MDKSEWMIRRSRRHEDRSLVISTPEGEEFAVADPYEADTYIAPLDSVRKVRLSDLRAVLRGTPNRTLAVSRLARDYFDEDYADRSAFLRPHALRGIEVEFTAMYEDEGGDDDEAMAARLVALLGPRLNAAGVQIERIELNGGAVAPPWPFDITLRVLSSGRTVADVLEMVGRTEHLLERLDGRRIDRSLAADLIRAGLPEALIGLPENRWLEVKRQLLDLKSIGGKIELAQDIARFANAEDGGLIIFGMTTRKTPGAETIAGFYSISVSVADVRRTFKSLEQHLYPPPDGLDVMVVGGPEGPLLAIDLPPQADELKPFLVHGAIVDGVTEGAFISIVRRRGEHSIPISPAAIHSSLAAGRALLRGTVTPPQQPVEGS